MKKMKTHSGAAKRFKKTAGGYKHRRAYRSHLLTGMRQRRKRRLRVMGRLRGIDAARARNLLRH